VKPPSSKSATALGPGLLLSASSSPCEPQPDILTFTRCVLSSVYGSSTLYKTLADLGGKYRILRSPQGIGSVEALNCMADFAIKHSIYS